MTDRGLAGRILLKPTKGPLASKGVTLLLVGTPATSGGAGGWEALARAGRRPAHWWTGGTERTCSIEGMLDVDHLTRRFEDGSEIRSTVERELQTLEQMGVAAGGQTSPPPLQLFGDVTDPYSARGGLWVVSALSLGDQLRLGDGRLRRAGVTIELVDFDDVPTIAPVKVGRTRASVAKPRTRRIRTRAGDTLRAIAVRELGAQASWDRIRTWNPGKLKGAHPVGPDDPLRAGVELLLK